MTVCEGGFWVGGCPVCGCTRFPMDLFHAEDAVSRGQMRVRWVALSDLRISRTLWTLPNPRRTNIFHSLASRWLL